MSMPPRPDPPSNWTLATALTVYDKQLVAASRDIAYELLRDTGREATVEEIEHELTGARPKPYPRMD
jgi:hypothetical protein